MKKIFTLIILLIFSTLSMAQTPDQISYQAVVRDGGNNLISNQTIGVQISILQGTATGNAVYIETHTPESNENGLVTFEIGTGTVVSGDFSTIDWSSNSYFVQTDMDPAGGINYTITAVSQLLSVPYALHAKTAEAVSGGINETDPVFAAWDKSTGIFINESQISDFGNYVETESDPEYLASEAANITATDITNLGNLSGVNTGDQDISGIAANTQAIKDTASQIRSDIPDVSGFLTSETDPVYSGSEAANITTTDITNLGNLSGTNTGDQDISGIATNTQSIQDTASQIRSDIPDVSGFLTSETDPVYSGSEAANITATDITNLGNLSGTNTGDQDISGIATNTQAIKDSAANIRGDLATVAFSGDYEDLLNIPDLSDTANYADQAALEDTASQIRNDIPDVKTYSVGDFAQGGIVFWVDETGQHGLVCAKEDQSTGVRWYAGTYGNTQAKGDGPYAGEANTSIIIAAQVAIGDDGSTYAARICNELQITEGGKTYGDWYLPSKEELNLMYQNKTTIDATATSNSGGGFASAYYWSSTEYYTHLSYAWFQYFDNGLQNPNKKFNTNYVRAVRAF